MRYQSTLIAVKDVKKSVAFYQKWFGLEVEVDLGWNVGLKGGLSLQQNFGWLIGLLEESVVTRAHNMELYFDCEDLDTVNEKLMQDQSIEWVHPMKEYPWKQRVVRIYDPDHHIIEIGDNMIMVFKRLMAQGHTLEQTAELTQHPIEFIRTAVEGI